MSIELSVVIPTFDEEDSIVPLLERTVTVLSNMGVTHEIIVVDDGSTDATLERVRSFDGPAVRVIKLRRNFGQTAALDAGFKGARGALLVPMDADGQNDPEDIPRLVAKLDDGYDVVSGWRQDRRDPPSKVFISRGAHVLRKILLRDNIHDPGCTLKVYRRECLEGLELYGEMHRFIPALLQWRGFKVTELPVRHHERRHGQTKYGLRRVIKGFLDMLVVSFWMKFSARPMHLFGSVGLLSTLVGFGIGAYLTILKMTGKDIGQRPLLLLAVLLIIVGVQFIVLGVLADILIKIYFKDTSTYSIEGTDDDDERNS